MQCPQCGAAVEHHEKFCRACGTSLKGITDATIQFTVDETDSSATNLAIAAHDTDNAPTFTTASGNISNRTLTTATVPWSPPAWTTIGAAGPDQQTPDLTAR